MLDLLAQSSTYTYTTTTTSADDAAAAGVFALFAGVYMVIWLAVAVVMIVSMWKIFEKGGQEGWKSIIPFYNNYVLAEMVGKPGWWGLTPLAMLIPLVNFVAWIPVVVLMILIQIELAKSFGKEPVWALLLIFIPVVGYPMLAFSDAKYVGPGGKGGSKPTAAKTA